MTEEIVEARAGRADLNLTLIVEQLFTPVPGGIGRYVSELVAHLPAMLAKPVTGYAARGNGEIEAVQIVRSKLPRALLYKSWHSFRRPRLPGSPEVIHAPNLAVPPPGNSALVVTIHDLAFEADPEHHTRWGVSFHRKGLELAERDARLVIVPSSVVEQDLLERHPKFEGRVRVIHHGVRPPKPDSREFGELRRRLGLEAPFVLWVGTREPRKNLPRLIQAFGLVARQGPDLLLALAGPEGWREQDPREIAERNGVADRVRVLGHVSEDDLEHLYSACEVFVYPSLQEGFGFPVIEAMAAGAPVVTSDRSSLPEAAGGAAVLVDPTRALSIAEGITEVLENPSRAGKLRAAGLKRAQEMTWDRSAAEHIRVYQEATR